MRKTVLILLVCTLFLAAGFGFFEFANASTPMQPKASKIIHKTYKNSAKKIKRKMIKKEEVRMPVPNTKPQPQPQPEPQLLLPPSPAQPQLAPLPPAGEPQSRKKYPVAAPLPWVPSSMTQPVPPDASKTRLTALPAPMDKIHLGIGAFGAHLGDHLEGLDHEWIGVKNGTPIESWADGEVYEVQKHRPNGSEEWRVLIDFGDGLIGEYMAIKTPLVKQGQRVRAGDPIGFGLLIVHTSGYHSAEFNLLDLYRRDGPLADRRSYPGAYVSPFDYLSDNLKKEFTDYFTKNVIEPYISKGTSFGSVRPWEPYLTNPLFLHKSNRGKLIGEWYLASQPWAIDKAWDVITFLPGNPMYYPEQRVEGKNDAGGDYLVGTWTVDYGEGTVVINSDIGQFRGFFELDEKGPRARLKLKLKDTWYEYIERRNTQIRQDAFELGVRKDIY